MSRLLVITFVVVTLISCDSIIKHGTPCITEDHFFAVRSAQKFTDNRHPITAYIFVRSFDYGKTCGFLFERESDYITGTLFTGPIEIILYKSDWSRKG